MEITDGAAWAIGGISSAVTAGGIWLYGRITAVHERIEKVVNHMTAEDNKLHARIDNVRDQYVRREDLDARMARIESASDKLLEKFEEHAASTRHKMNNIEQVVVRLDERMKHMEAGT